jgi:adenosylcobinamide kinase/adenosylcobinamide-phosphate guanylyltransferase
LWLSNLLLRDSGDAAFANRLDALEQALRARRFHCIVVTNEVGMGVVPESALGRRFRDWAGLAHQRLSALSDEIYLGALGCMLRLRPEPVALQIDQENHAKHA